MRPSQEWRQTRLDELQEFSSALVRVEVGTAEINSSRPRHSEIMRSCFVIVVASLAGVAPDSASTSRRNFERAALRWSGAPQKIYCRARPRHSKKIEDCFVIVNASLAGVAPDSACNEPQEF
jgi:hypothetical protein